MLHQIWRVVVGRIMEEKKEQGKHTQSDLISGGSKPENPTLEGGSGRWTRGSSGLNLPVLVWWKEMPHWAPFDVSLGVGINHIEMKIPTLTCSCERDPGAACSCVFLKGLLEDVGQINFHSAVFCIFLAVWVALFNFERWTTARTIAGDGL